MMYFFSADPCANVNCNNGQCSANPDGTYECVCNRGFYGDNCDEGLCLLFNLIMITQGSALVRLPKFLKT